MPLKDKLWSAFRVSQPATNPNNNTKKLKITLCRFGLIFLLVTIEHFCASQRKRKFFRSLLFIRKKGKKKFFFKKFNFIDSEQGVFPKNLMCLLIIDVIWTVKVQSASEMTSSQSQSFMPFAYTPLMEAQFVFLQNSCAAVENFPFLGRNRSKLVSLLLVT